MTTLPPHLPPKASSRKQFALFQTLPWVLFFIALCIITAFAVSTALFAWYIPTYMTYQFPTSASRSMVSVETSDIHPLFAKEIEERLFTLYTGTIDAPPELLTQELRLTEAISISSDGAIAFLLGTVPRNMIAVSKAGSVYAVEGVQTDATTGIHYATVVGDGFRVVTFSAPIKDDVVYIEQKGEWRTASLSSQTLVQDKNAFLLHAPLHAYSIAAENGAHVYDANGDFVGFVQEGVLVPSWWVQQSLGAVLSGTSVVHAAYPYRVRQIDKLFDAEQSLYRPVHGLEVVRSPFVATEDTLAIGDIITALDGSAPDLSTLAELVQARSSLTVSILRDGVPETVTLTQE